MTQPRSGDAGPALIESILEALPNPVFVKDEQHRWIILNDAFCQLMGRPRQDLLGKSDFDYFPKEQAEVFWAKDDLVLATGLINENEEVFTDAAGRAHILLTRKMVQRDARGRRCLVGVITDLTARKQAEEALRRSRDELEGLVQERTAELIRLNAQLQDADRRKDEFIGVLSHELRNPLAPVLHALDLLARAEPGSAHAATAREVIERQLGHLARLVDDLLDVTRISRGRVLLRRERVDLVEVVRRAMDDHRALFEGRGITLELQAPEAPLPIEADRARLAQVVGNLLHNALKFTDAGGRVRATVDRGADGAARLRLADDGIGIPPDLLERVFEPFAQADQGLHRSAGGLGLGLALVKSLVELHGGSVAARSPGAGQGTELEVTVPLAVAATSQPEPAGPSPSPAPDVAPRRILVVEDNHDAADMLRMLLEAGGHRVEVAHDGREGLARARDFRPDLVVCDLGLPTLDGYAVARALRADPAHAGIELVALSGYALSEDLRKSREAGFDWHLAKPVRIGQIEEVVRGSGRGRS